MSKDIWQDREGKIMERDINELNETDYHSCSQCGREEKESETVLDYIQENRICNRKKCIEESMRADLEMLEGSEYNKAVEYYGKML